MGNIWSGVTRRNTKGMLWINIVAKHNGVSDTIDHLLVSYDVYNLFHIVENDKIKLTIVNKFNAWEYIESYLSTLFMQGGDIRLEINSNYFVNGVITMDKDTFAKDGDKMLKKWITMIMPYIDEIAN